MKELKVGDMVWYVPSDKRHSNPNGCYKPVTKVGKRYVYVDGMKCEGWKIDNYAVGNICEYPYGSVYLTEQDYIESSDWKTFTYNIPTNLTREQKAQILAIVKGETE